MTWENRRPAVEASPRQVPSGAGGSAGGVGDTRSLILAHLERYPMMQIEDLYKLLHQSAFGTKHAAKVAESARQWLQQEIASLTSKHAPKPNRMEPLVDPISPDGGAARIHLRPYLEAGHDVETLLQAFVRTAREHESSIEDFRRAWSEALDLALENHLPFDPATLAAFVAREEAAGLPAVHHSPTYIREYAPAYRVVLLRLLPESIRG